MPDTKSEGMSAIAIEPNDPRLMFDRLGRADREYPLFRAVYDVLVAAPSSRHYDEEEIASEALDALDYLVTDGKWRDISDDGRVELRWNGKELSVYETAGDGFEFRRGYPVQGPGDIYHGL